MDDSLVHLQPFLRYQSWFFETKTAIFKFVLEKLIDLDSIECHWIENRLNQQHWAVVGTVEEARDAFPEMLKLNDQIVEKLTLTDNACRLKNKQTMDKLILGKNMTLAKFQETVSEEWVEKFLAKQWLKTIELDGEKIVVLGVNGSELITLVNQIEQFSAMSFSDKEMKNKLIDEGFISSQETTMALIIEKGESFPDEQVDMDKTVLEMTEKYYEFLVKLHEFKSVRYRCDRHREVFVHILPHYLLAKPSSSEADIVRPVIHFGCDHQSYIFYYERELPEVDKKTVIIHVPRSLNSLLEGETSAHVYDMRKDELERRFCCDIYANRCQPHKDPVIEDKINSSFADCILNVASVSDFLMLWPVMQKYPKTLDLQLTNTNESSGSDDNLVLNHAPDFCNKRMQIFRKLLTGISKVDETYSNNIAVTLGAHNPEVISVCNDLNRLYPGTLILKMERMPERVMLTVIGKKLVKLDSMIFAKHSGALPRYIISKIFNAYWIIKAVKRKWLRLLEQSDETLYFPGDNASCFAYLIDLLQNLSKIDEKIWLKEKLILIDEELAYSEGMILNLNIKRGKNYPKTKRLKESMLNNILEFETSKTEDKRL